MKQQISSILRLQYANTNRCLFYVPPDVEMKRRHFLNLSPPGWRREATVVSSLKFPMECGCVELLYRQGVEIDIGYISLQIYFIIKYGYL